MFFPITTLAALALTSSSFSSSVLAVATTHNTPRRRQTADPHIVDFRTYGAPGCFADNQGVYTYEQSDVGTCFPFVTLPVESLFVTDITDGCHVYAYTDSACTENQITVPVGIANCYNSTTASLNSFETVCS